MLEAPPPPYLHLLGVFLVSVNDSSTLGFWSQQPWNCRGLFCLSSSLDMKSVSQHVGSAFQVHSERNCSAPPTTTLVSAPLLLSWVVAVASYLVPASPISPLTLQPVLTSRSEPLKTCVTSCHSHSRVTNGFPFYSVKVNPLRGPTQLGAPVISSISPSTRGGTNSVTLAFFQICLGHSYLCTWYYSGLPYSQNVLSPDSYLSPHCLQVFALCHRSRLILSDHPT